MKSRSLVMGLVGLVLSGVIGCGSEPSQQTAASASGSGSSSGAGGSGGDGGNGGSGGGVMCPDGIAVAFTVVGPMNPSYVGGTLGADFLEVDVENCFAKPLNLIAVQSPVAIDCNTAGTFSVSGSADTAGFCPAESSGSASKDVISNAQFFVGANPIGTLQNVAANGSLIFNNLNVALAPQSVMRIRIEADVNSSAPFGDANDRIKLSIGDVILTYDNGPIVAPEVIDLTGATNDGDADSGYIVTITK